MGDGRVGSNGDHLFAGWVHMPRDCVRCVVD